MARSPVHRRGRVAGVHARRSAGDSRGAADRVWGRPDPGAPPLRPWCGAGPARLPPTMTEGTRTPVPRDPVIDHTDEMAAKRRAFVAERTGEGLEHVGQYS